MRIAAIVVVALVALACGSGERGGSMESAEGAVVKVRVYSDGRITLDNATVDLEELTAAFAALAEKNGSVWYYREDGAAEPHQNAMAVVEAVVNAKLPISMSTVEDFSDVVLPDGTTNARE